MYESPIEKIYGELQTQMVQEDENMVIKAVRKVGVNVDKYELIKALQYDRNQYEKGYEDGKNEVLDKIRAEIANLDDVDYNYEGYYKAVADALHVIDKYKAEEEDDDI